MQEMKYWRLLGIYLYAYMRVFVYTVHLNAKTTGKPVNSFVHNVFEFVYVEQFF